MKDEFLILDVQSVNNTTTFPISVIENNCELSRNLQENVLRGKKLLPDLIRSDMPKYLVHFMATEIIVWIVYHYEHFRLLNPYLLSILRSSHFTLKGTLDWSLIAGDIVQDENLDNLLRIGIAIHFCFMEEISTLWGELTEDERERVRQGSITDLQVKDLVMWNRIIYFATDYDRNDDNYLIPVCLDNFVSNNEVAFKNCWMCLDSSVKLFKKIL